MQVIHERCAGIDVHKKTMVVCVLLTQINGSVEKQIRTSRTMAADLLALEEWLARQQIEHIAMESTGVSWYPVSHEMCNELSSSKKNHYKETTVLILSTRCGKR